MNTFPPSQSPDSPASPFAQLRELWLSIRTAIYNAANPTPTHRLAAGSLNVGGRA